MTEVYLAGTGVPTPNAQRMGSCVVVAVDGEPILFDCGRGAATQLVKLGLDPWRVRHVFLTHHHFDHTIGLPDLMLGSWQMGRDTPLRVFGPAGTKHFAESIFETFRIDIESRLKKRDGREGTASLLEAIPMEIDEGPVFETPDWSVRAVRVVHLENALGLRIDTKDRSIVFSGDTKPCPALVELAQDADVLVHEVFFSPEMEATGAPFGRRKEFVNPQWGERVRHTKPNQVGVIATQARVKKLVLTHLWSNQEEDRLRELVAAHFDGEIAIGRDLMEV